MARQALQQKTLPPAQVRHIRHPCLPPKQTMGADLIAELTLRISFCMVLFRWLKNEKNVMRDRLRGILSGFISFQR